LNENEKWTASDIPDQANRVAVVTGANAGLGYETSRALAQKGAMVVMACRNLTKAAAAAEQIRQEQPSSFVEVMELDLADLDSIRQFAAALLESYDRLDLLINNAGVMVPPLGRTTQGFETQMGVNHFGHFALTGLLVGAATETPGARVVTVSSTAHRIGKIEFKDLNWESRRYNASLAYGQSKLANLLFTYELQRRLAATGKDTLSVAAHPGYANTSLQRHWSLVSSLNQFFAQPASMGALPTLYAATGPEVMGGTYFGPNGFLQQRGYPRQVTSSSRSHDRAAAEKLWRVSEELTGVTYPI
jgi:NAD(P)-dependent dehydrogenase (short-subunit alcohol dehydrogenase family)